MVAHWLAELDGRRVTVEVPGSSANLGAGYDCLGVALAIVDRVEVEVRGWSRGQIELSVDGEGRDELTEDRDNRFVRGLEAALGAARGELPEGVGWRIDMRNEIPLARGLGSSAAATVAGIVAGNALLGGPLDTATQLRIATGSKATRTMPRPPSLVASSCRPRPPTVSRRSGSTRRAICEPCCSSRS